MNPEQNYKRAVDLLYKNAVYGYNDWQIARKYFAEQENNEQWAFLKEKSTKANIPYKVDISWRRYRPG